MTDRPHRARRQAHPLLRAFPLTVMSVGTFLVVFALLLARVQPGSGGALSARVASSPAGAPARSAPLTTRASGGVAGPSTNAPPAPTAEAPAAAPPVSTRTSGASRDSGRDE